MKCEKKIKVSEKRQITIPKSFCTHLNITDKVKIYIDEQRICIEAVNPYEEIKDCMLNELTRKGYRGKDLEEKIIEQKDKMDNIFIEMVREVKQSEASNDVINRE